MSYSSSCVVIIKFSGSQQCQHWYSFLIVLIYAMYMEAILALVSQVADELHLYKINFVQIP